MKIIAKSYLWIVFAGLIGFSACTGDTEETPVPTLSINTNSLGANQTGGTAATGTTVTINLTAKADEGIAKLNATKTVSGTETTLSGYPKTSGFTSSNEHTWNATYLVEETSGTVTLKFSVEDKKGKITSKTFTVTVQTQSQPDLKVYTDKLLGGQQSPEPSFFASSTGNLYVSADAQLNAATVDITYAALGSSLTPTLLSYAERANPPFNSSNVPNGALQTKFAATTLSAADYTAITSSSDASFVSGTANVSSSSAQSVAVETGKVYAFLSEGKKGLIHIKSITSGGDGSVTINVKVLQ